MSNYTESALVECKWKECVACACVSFVFKVGVCVGQQPRLCLTRHSTLLQTGVALVSKPRTSEADFGVHQKGKEEFPTQAKLFFFFLLCAITPEHSLDCCQDLPCKTWFLFSHDGHFYDILFVTTGTSEGIWWHRWMLLPQFLLIHFQRVWFPLIHHLFPLSHTFSFSPWGLWLGSYLTWPISLFYPRVPRLNTPLNAYTCLSVSSGRMCVPPLCVCVFVCVCVCVCVCARLFCGRMWSALIEVNQRNPRVQKSNSITFIDRATFSASVPSHHSLSTSLSFLQLLCTVQLWMCESLWSVLVEKCGATL